MFGAILVTLAQKLEAQIPGHSAQRPPTVADFMEHRSRIDNHILEGRRLLLVAHSQGNLFANGAYRHAVRQASADAVRLVHIAPASPRLNGPHTLADQDLVINGLRAVGSVPSNTDSIPGYRDRPAGLNGQTDILGHGLLEIYLNPSLRTSARIKNHILAAMHALVPPPAQASPGLFTATLTWDGEGDVDLHTAEPGGGYVYYPQKRGYAGYLDVDNTHAYGPEHYFASCHPDEVREGTYAISVANYARAEGGRAATVQIASHRDGVLGTRTVTLGEATGDSPSHNMFKVQVKKNPKNGRYDVSLAR